MLVVCAGTATEIGKTWMGAQVLSRLRQRGLSVAARKPAQSFDPADSGPTDAEVLAAATGQDPHDVCPRHRWYPIPMAPPMAAAALDRPPFRVHDLLREWQPPMVDVLWLETVGGPRSPLAEDGDTIDLCDIVEPDLVVLVADAGLGTINAVMLSREAFSAEEILVVLNRYDDRTDLHRRNRRWLYANGVDDLVIDADGVADRIGAMTGTATP